MDPQWIIAACAAAGLLITWTSTMIGVAVWILRRLDVIKEVILADSKAKHAENSQRIEAMQRLVIRHDTLLDPEFFGNGKFRQANQQ